MFLRTIKKLDWTAIPSSPSIPSNPSSSSSPIISTASWWSQGYIYIYMYYYISGDRFECSME